MTTFVYDGNVKCAHCGLTVGSAFVACKVPQTREKTRYMHFDCWHREYQPSELASFTSGTQNKTGCAYRVTMWDNTNSHDLRAAMLEAKGGNWYPIAENAYVSPQYQSMRWHRKLETFASLCESGTLAVSILDYEGNIIDVLVFSWADRNQRGQFLAKDAKKRNGFLRAIDAATELRKGYTNYPEKH